MKIWHLNKKIDKLFEDKYSGLFEEDFTRIYNKMSGKEEKNRLWQKSYYEHIIRNPIYEIQKYIEQNPISDKEDY